MFAAFNIFKHFTSICFKNVTPTFSHLWDKDKKRKEVLYPETRNELSPLEVVCAGCSSLHGCPHPVPVVLTDEDDRQLPQSCHVVGFKDLTLQSAHVGFYYLLLFFWRCQRKVTFKCFICCWFLTGCLTQLLQVWMCRWSLRHSVLSASATYFCTVPGWLRRHHRDRRTTHCCPDICRQVQHQRPEEPEEQKLTGRAELFSPFIRSKAAIFIY